VNKKKILNMLLDKTAKYKYNIEKILSGEMKI